MSMDRDSSDIEARAAEHLARRMAGERPARRDGLAEWLLADTRHADAYEEAERAWDEVGALDGDPELEALLQADLETMRRPRGWFLRAPFLATAAALLLVVGMGYLYLRPAPELPLSFATALGERRTETLADGTRLTLNTGTALQARYAYDRRELDLEQGEAQFDVAKDTARPFVVHVGDGTVTALGTRFQVRLDGAEVRITLLEGSVEVVQGGERRVLAPNQQARWGVDGGITVTAIAADQATAWLNGQLRFTGVPLSQVIAEANRYTAYTLRLSDPTLAGVELSGIFTAGDNQSIATAVERILPVKAEDTGSEILLRPR